MTIMSFIIYSKKGREYISVVQWTEEDKNSYMDSEPTENTYGLFWNELREVMFTLTP